MAFVGFGGDRTGCHVGIGVRDCAGYLGRSDVLADLVHVPFVHRDGFRGVAAEAIESKTGKVGQKIVGQGEFQGR